MKEHINFILQWFINSGLILIGLVVVKSILVLIHAVGTPTLWAAVIIFGGLAFTAMWRKS